jgi:hypothetical protein
MQRTRNLLLQQQLLMTTTTPLLLLLLRILSLSRLWMRLSQSP